MTVLLGKNNEGKSNILHAMNISINAFFDYVSGIGYRPSTTRNYRERNFNRYKWDRDFPMNENKRKQKERKTKFKLGFLLTDKEVEDFFQETGSILNGVLPLEITVDEKEKPIVKIAKQGRAQVALLEKMDKIAKFVADRIQFIYIPAIRTEDHSVLAIREMISDFLSGMEDIEDYQRAKEIMINIEKKHLNLLSKNVLFSLGKFIPSISNVEIYLERERRGSFGRNDLSIVIDDGNKTALEQKGDGVKSLVALALLNDRAIYAEHNVIAIEEPESHLHPETIRQIKEIISDISASNQVIISTHNSIFVDRENVENNIIVGDGFADPAKNVDQIRSTLGIDVTDNLIHGSHVLLVEGDNDVIVVRKMIEKNSPDLFRYIISGELIIAPLAGASKLPFVAQFYAANLYGMFALLDNDAEGKKAHESEVVKRLFDSSDVRFSICLGMKEAELEDCINVEIYAEELQRKFGVNVREKVGNRAIKFSDRMKEIFLRNGLQWDDRVKATVKSTVADMVSKTEGKLLIDVKAGSLVRFFVHIYEKMSKRGK